MYDNIDVGCISKEDFIVLCEDYVRERVRYEETGDMTSFIKYSTIVESIFTLGLNHEFGQFCEENETIKELKKWKNRF